MNYLSSNISPKKFLFNIQILIKKVVKICAIRMEEIILVKFRSTEHVSLINIDSVIEIFGRLIAINVCVSLTGYYVYLPLVGFLTAVF